MASCPDAGAGAAGCGAETLVFGLPGKGDEAEPSVIHAPATAASKSPDAKTVSCRDVSATGCGGGTLVFGLSGIGCGGGTPVFGGSGTGDEAEPRVFRAPATAAAPSKSPDTKTAPRRLEIAMPIP